jgi:tRNA(adenine34) deaminase
MTDAPRVDHTERLDDQAAMALALTQARLAPAHGDVPVGCVLVRHGQLLAARHNERELRQDPTAHAEILALRDAAATLGSWRLEGVTAAVTLEPCPMCAGALLASRLQRVVYATPDPKAGALGTLYNLGADPRLHHELLVEPGLRAEEAAALLSQFFAARR